MYVGQNGTPLKTKTRGGRSGETRAFVKRGESQKVEIRGSRDTRSSSTELTRESFTEQVNSHSLLGFEAL